jgi:hypothetical protein
MIVEKRRDRRSNRFSEAHRICLPANFCLFDVDGILLDEDRNPKFLYEEKYKRFSKDKGDFIGTFYDPRNKQAFFLRTISQKIGVYIHEEKTNKWWFLKDRTLYESENPMLDKIKTADRIYIEDIMEGYKQKLSGVFVRTEGEKPSDMEQYGDFIAQIIGIPKVLVNDVFESDYIHFKNEEKLSKGEDDSDWEKVWEDLNLLD